jgi:hypothetical protein
VPKKTFITQWHVFISVELSFSLEVVRLETQTCRTVINLIHFFILTTLNNDISAVEIMHDGVRWKDNEIEYISTNIWKDEV